MSNRDLEVMADAHLQAEVVALRKQRDDLLAACESVRDLIYSHSHGYYTIDYTDLAALLPEIRAAIAAAHGN